MILSHNLGICLKMHKRNLILNLDHFCFFSIKDLVLPISASQSTMKSWWRVSSALLIAPATQTWKTAPLQTQPQVFLSSFCSNSQSHPSPNQPQPTFLTLLKVSKKPQISAYIKTSIRAHVILFSLIGALNALIFCFFFRKHRRLRAGDKKNIELNARGQ